MKKRFCWNCKTEVPYINYKSYIGIPICSNCGVQYPEKAELEARLSLKQNKWLETHNDDDLADLFVDIPELCFNIVCKHLKSKQKKLDKEEIWNMANWMVLSFYKKYRKTPNFRVDSFTSYLDAEALYPVNNPVEVSIKKHEVSMYMPLGSSDNSKSTKFLEDTLSNKVELENETEENLLDEELKKSIPINMSNNLMNFIDEKFENKEISLNESVQLVILFDLFCKKRYPKYFDEAFKTSSYKLQDIWEDMVDYLKEKLVINE